LEVDMPDGFGIVSTVLSPILERVAREERLGRDHPRKNRDGRPEKNREEAGSGEVPSAEPEKADNSMSSSHIDLRI
jgi:hypothetical protein